MQGAAEYRLKYVGIVSALLSGCYIPSFANYPSTWEPLDETGPVDVEKSISGEYKCEGELASTYAKGTVILTTFLIRGTVDRLGQCQTAIFSPQGAHGIRIEFRYLDGHVKTAALQRGQDYEVVGNWINLRRHREFQDGQNGFGFVAGGNRLTLTTNRALIVKSEAKGFGLMLMVPFVDAGHNFARFNRIAALP